MFTTRKSWLSLLFILFCNTALANTQPIAQTQRDLFQSTYKQLKKGQTSKARAHFSALKNYPLYPWLEFELIQDNFEETPDQRILDFVTRYPNSVMSDQLYTDWAKRLAKINDWSVIAKHIPNDHPSTSIKCYHTLALANTQQATTALMQAQQLWQQNNDSLPKICTQVIQLLDQNQRISTKDYWQRASQAIKNKKYAFALRLAKFMPKKQARLTKLWVSVARNPKKYLKKTYKEPNSAELREIIVHGLERASLKKLGDALKLWKQVKNKFPFTEQELGAINSDIGMWEAWRQRHNSLNRFRSIKPQHLTPNGKEWMARIAVRYSEWHDVLTAINAMDGEQGSEGAWRYWKARALIATGQDTKAHQILAELAQSVTYYGFLAADHLGQRYHTLRQGPPNYQQRIAALENLAAIQRWQEWMALDQRGKARKEWFRLLKTMDKQGMLAAAQLAQQKGDPNLAIWTVSRTKDWNQVALRFPMGYQSLVLENAQEQGIIPAWVYGVMRRESAFDPTARSHAKALGLMQILPSTARGVARKLGMKVRTNADILKPATNVQLGSAYLKNMYNKFAGDYSKATAAYNAGPHRIPKWTPKTSMAAAQWIESIPFRETRNYVQAVMAYTTIYDYKLHGDQARRLSSRLKPITSQ